MCILFLVLILVGSFSSSLSDEKCRYDKIFTEVLRFCKGSDSANCNSELTNITTFLQSFLTKADFFCKLPRLKRYCKACPQIPSSGKDLIAAGGNATNATGNGSSDTGNGKSTTGN